MSDSHSTAGSAGSAAALDGSAGSAAALDARALHQFVPMLIANDAVGGHTLDVQRLARAAGLASKIFVDTINGEEPAEVHHFSAYADLAGPGDVLVYQLAVASPMVEMLCSRDEPLVVNYHNITPPDAFAPWDYVAVLDQTRARDELVRLATRASGGLAASHFNEAELIDAGYRHTAVLPVLLDLGRNDEQVDTPTMEHLTLLKKAGGSDWLFVGRLAPNKGQDRLIRALYVHRKLYDPDARLHLVGREVSPAYAEAIRRYVDVLGLAGCIEIVADLTAAELSAYYRSADVYVCLSEHEGFGAPLLEAFDASLPVVAYAAGVIPEMLGPAGMRLGSAAPTDVATAIARLLRDERLRASLIARGHERLREIDMPGARDRTLSTLLSLASR